MKKLYLFSALVFLVSTSFGQSNVYLKINHKLGASNFQFSTPASNNNNVQFNVERLQYYVDEIKLVHDGGMETAVPNTWLLVDAGTTVNEMLGSFSINTLEGIKFGIGVESAYNHLDPSSYASSHPLAPQFPSMHWGWSAGYRFVAMEGKSGSNFNQTYEIHALEDQNYFTTSISTAGTMNGSDLIIELDADYEEALRNIDVSTGVINHGGNGEAVTLLQNFRDHVFSASGVSTSLEDEMANASEAGLYPNPAVANQPIHISGTSIGEVEIVVSDLSGKVLANIPATGIAEVSIQTPGIYMVSIFDQGKRVSSQKLIVLGN